MKTLLKKIAVFLLPRNTILRTTFSDGTIVCGENKPGYGGRGVFIFGEAQEHELRLLPSLLNKGDVVVDVGANIGTYTMRSAKIVGPSGMVIAVEPFPRMAAMNLSNALRNNFNNVRLRVCCVADRDGHQDFWMKANKPNSFTLLETPGYNCFNSRVERIDTLFEAEGLSRLDFIKIDAEGVENEVLAGAKHVIDKFRPMILLEVIITENPNIPPGYVALRYQDSHNLLLVHQDSPRLDQIKAIGFTELSQPIAAMI
ncbi:methyltransferase FkbM family [Thalassoporum mexicanum PCC 7367]|uniref:FkbM family methyltransferase n=1 Tax=Thalassoporum mexicanum TaxID=3457544 RepID=UPI00029FF3E9|nr:FkbM family methyltransferase [Pseudanabaena sp. PCC 7367]AFY70263.1 methyltransferase FkbM family [Pseudanabaena sp. PCC 7367]